MNIQLPALHLASGLDSAGPGRIAATVKTQGTPPTPARRRVRLHAGRGGRPLRETFSDPVTGVYEFRHVRLGVAYTVVGLDHTGLYNATIAAPVYAQPMEPGT